MNTKNKSAGYESEKTPFGKVMGVLQNRNQLQAVSSALSKLGVRQIEVLDGAAGVNLLDNERDAVSACFLGDMEEETVKRYRHAVKNGWIVFSAVVEPDMAAHAAETAKSLGASEIVHFGSLVITNY